MKRIFSLLLSASSFLFSQTLDERITSILSQMTIEEKILQLHQEGSFNTADNSRFAIPGFIMADGPHGVREGTATSFPVGIGMAATWDVDLAYRVGAAMGKEFRGKGKHQQLGPCLDLDRDPRNGRSPESGGEDPYLCAQINTAAVKGIQSVGTIATIKHFNANHRESGRMSNNVVVSQRLLMEHYGLAFRTAVQEGGAFSVMNAYNQINGQKCAENSNLLSHILRNQWGFPYFVVSDWNSIWTSANAIKAGCDVCMGADNYKNDLPGLAANGTVPASVIDQAVRRVLRTKILTGMTDYQPPANPADVNSAEHQKLCLEAGKKSLILLKNENSILPLDTSSLRIVALIGPNAAVAQTDGTGSSWVTPPYSVSVKQALQSRLGTNRVFYTKGCDINSAETGAIASAVQLARAADVVIYCGGLDPTQEGEGFDRVGGSIALPGKQQELINALGAANQKLIVILFSGGICGIEQSASAMKGLLYALYPGQESGNAIADVLFGNYNPGGKLPVTYPKNDQQLPPWNDNFNNDGGYGYRYFDKFSLTPQFAFGFGLSYTSFAYANLKITPASIFPGEPVTVTADITNIGSCAGEEAAQLYLTDDASSAVMPAKQLKGFKRVALQPGEKKSVEFILSPEEMYYFSEAANRFEIEAGTFTVRVGGSSDALPLAASFTVKEGTRKPDLRIVQVKTMPAYPVKGQKVVFLAAVKNQGAAPTEAGKTVKVQFTMNGSIISWSTESSASIPAGGMVLVCANGGPSGTYQWNADSPGNYSVEATVDPGNTIDEYLKSNNTTLGQFTVHPPPPQNFALRKNVTVSSVEGTDLGGEKAVDGYASTRWSSAFSDPQSITVDLGAPVPIDNIVLKWEAAYGSEYFIMTSQNGLQWQNMHHEANGDGGIDIIPVKATARFVRMYGIKRATQYGYSLYELEVYGSDVSSTKIKKETIPEEFALMPNYPNPFNPVTTIGFSIPAASHVRIDIVTMLGQTVDVLSDQTFEPGNYSVVWTPAAASGIYFCRFEAQPLAGSSKKIIELQKMTLVR